VIVDLAAQTAAPLARWVKDSDLLPLMGEMGVTVNFWHVADAGKDSVDLLNRLVNTYSPGPNYIVVRNLGRSSDFTLLDESSALKKALAMGGCVVTLPQLHEASMRKIDRQNASFWNAIHTTRADPTRWACSSASASRPGSGMPTRRWMPCRWPDLYPASAVC
jgi:hypothetical protein